uniref:Uncharacterized protein n=1 Tax=Ditylenchus dipsaci TaxID=166011 RepID=A0A915CZ29_9BILA
MGKKHAKKGFLPSSIEPALFWYKEKKPMGTTMDHLKIPKNQTEKKAPVTDLEQVHVKVFDKEGHIIPSTSRKSLSTKFFAYMEQVREKKISQLDRIEQEQLLSGLNEIQEASEDC